MVGLFSVAEGIEASVATTFEKVPGLTVMQPGAPIPLFSRLPAAWGAEIGALSGVHVVHPEVWARANLIEWKPSFNPPRFLFGSDLESGARLRYSVYREGLREGRALTPDDRGTSNTIISRAIADQFHKEVGQTLRVSGLDLEIVGIYQCNSLFLDVSIILDIDLVRQLAGVGPDQVCDYYVEPELDVDREKLADLIRETFRDRAPAAWRPTLDLAGANGAGNRAGNPVPALLSAMADARGSQEEPAAEASPIEVRSPDDWAKQFKRFSADLDIFLLLMTAIGVTIAFVGIVNTMLMSVTERFIEFGILKANGWSNGNVLRLIAFESALLGLAGGVIGSILGWIATHAVNAHWPTRIHLYAGPRLLVFSLCFSTVLGVLGGLYPALRASRMMPMDAIRRG
jgi:putative ABC transport system permease protein